MQRNSKIANFGRDVDASMTIMVMILFVGMIGMAGIAVDIARYEANRAKIQTHLDNATLAAASLRQTEDPEVVLNKYLATAGLDVTHDIKVVNKVSTITYRYIEATASIDVNTYFMGLFGVDVLDLKVASSATERVPLLEVSLVLDISGSMDGTRLNALIPAAKKFVSDLLSGNDDDNPHRVSISLIPYNMQVNAGQRLFEAVYGETNVEHEHSFCAEWDSSSFNDTGFSSSGMDQASHMAYNNPGDSRYDLTLGSLEQPYCRTEEFAQILPLSNDEVALHAQIDALEARGNTSIDIGVKWGMALLDPTSQDVIEDLAGLWLTDNLGDLLLDVDGGLQKTDRQAIEPSFIGRPVAYSDEFTQKVLIVMTDGENTTEYRIRDTYKGSNNSGVYHKASTDSYSFSSQSSSNGWQQLSWDEMWPKIPLYAYLVNKGGRWTNFWDYGYNNGAKNTRLQNICTAAKTAADDNDNPVAVFSIAYSATDDGEKELLKCASGSAFYYETDHQDISNVFDEIGGVIEKLKLVQ